MASSPHSGHSGCIMPHWTYGSGFPGYGSSNLAPHMRHLYIPVLHVPDAYVHGGDDAQGHEHAHEQRHAFTPFGGLSFGHQPMLVSPVSVFFKTWTVQLG